MRGTGLNSDAFDGVVQTILKFSFRGSRKVVASHLCMSRDLDDELLGKSAEMLSTLYVHRIVRKVEILTYGGGGWATDEWREGLRLLDEHGTPTVLSAGDEEDEE